MQRNIEAPAQEWLKKPEAAAWLGVGEKLFQALVNDDTFPPGIDAGHKTRLWHWSDVWAMSRILSWQQRPKPVKGKDDDDES